jgi:RNA polymerase sigma-70 factor (ECF subfamily)
MVEYCAGEFQMLEDRKLVARVKRGDKVALRMIYEKYERDLFTLAAHLLADPAGAEDVLQDVIVAFVQSVHGLSLRGSLKAYLATAVANRARDHYRRESRRRISSLDAAEHLGASDDGPVRTVIRAEQMQEVEVALAALPYEQREVVMLRVHADMKFREIAEHQNVSVKTALSRYQYGLDKLRAMLDGEVPNEP